MTVGSAEQYSSRSIQLVDAAILASSDAGERLVLFAKKAGSLARLSCLADARSLVKELRAANSAYDPRLSAWIIFAEGLIQHFDTLDNAKSKDKFYRAHLVSQMAGDRELAGASAAWMAHCELVEGRIEEAIKHVAIAFEWSDPDYGETRGRASMVLADSLNYAGQPDLARHWYREARNHAVHDGDIAMQNVMLFNAAVFGVANLTLKDCLDPVTESECKRTSMEVASAANLNAALGLESLSSLVPIMTAELLTAQHKWGQALALFDRNLPTFALEGQKRLQPKVLAQRAWCKANLDALDDARSDTLEALRLIDDCRDSDDLAVLHFRIAAVGSLLNDSEMQAHHQALAANSLHTFRQEQSKTLALLQDVITSIAKGTKNPA